jgi:hypothetical protein
MARATLLTSSLISPPRYLVQASKAAVKTSAPSTAGRAAAEIARSADGVTAGAGGASSTVDAAAPSARR